MNYPNKEEILNFLFYIWGFIGFLISLVVGVSLTLIITFGSLLLLKEIGYMIINWK